MDLPLALQNVLDSPLNNLNYEPLDLSSRVEYALLALLALANHPDQQHPLTIGGITARHGIPERYLEQILTILRRGGIVHSQRGARGGYTLTREPRQISLLEVIALMDGTRKPREHSLLTTPEREVLHKTWQQANVISQTFLQNCTLQDLCQQLEALQQKAPMYYI